MGVALQSIMCISGSTNIPNPPSASANDFIAWRSTFQRPTHATFYVKQRIFVRSKLTELTYQGRLKPSRQLSRGLHQARVASKTRGHDLLLKSVADSAPTYDCTSYHARSLSICRPCQEAITWKRVPPQISNRPQPLSKSDVSSSKLGIADMRLPCTTAPRPQPLQRRMETAKDSSVLSLLPFHNIYDDSTGNIVLCGRFAMPRVGIIHAVLLV